MTRIRQIKIAFFVFTAASLSGCGANEGVLRSGRESPAPAVVEEIKPNEFERDLAEVRNANFTWIYVVRRRDGDTLESEDRVFIRSHTEEANRRVLTDDRKAVIIGSNYSVTADRINELRKLFDVSDLSPAPQP